MTHSNAGHSISARSAARTVNSLYKELNYGTAVYRRLYCDLGLNVYFRSVSAAHQLPFSFDTLIFALCYFNIERKRSEPLDVANLDKRRCLFDFSCATADNIQQALPIMAELEPEFVPYINERTRKLLKLASQGVKHSPNPKVVLKSLAYMLRCLFILWVQRAGYKISKEPLFTLLNTGTILRRGVNEDEGYHKVNKAFGLYGTETNHLTVRKLMALFDIDAALPMRNFAELTDALRLDLPLNPAIKKETPEVMTEPYDATQDIDDKPATAHIVPTYGVDFLFAQNHKEKSHSKD